MSHWDCTMAYCKGNDIKKIKCKKFQNSENNLGTKFLSAVGFSLRFHELLLPFSDGFRVNWKNTNLPAENNCIKGQINCF